MGGRPIANSNGHLDPGCEEVGSKVPNFDRPINDQNDIATIV